MRPLLFALTFATINQVTAFAAVNFTSSPGGDIVVTVTQTITLPLIASPQAVSGTADATVYINFEDVYSGVLTGGAKTVTPTLISGFQASIGGVVSTGFSATGRRTNDSGIRDTTDFYIAFTFPNSVTTKGVGDSFILTAGSINLTGVNTPALPDFSVTTAQLGGITNNVTLSNAATLIPEPSTAVISFLGAFALLRRRR